MGLEDVVTGYHRFYSSRVDPCKRGPLRFQQRSGEGCDRKINIRLAIYGVFRMYLLIEVLIGLRNVPREVDLTPE